MPLNIDLVLERDKFFNTEKTIWNNTYQLVSDYVTMDGANFTSIKPQGQLLNEDVFDSTANRAWSILASAFVGILWPNGAQSLDFRVVHEKLKDEPEAQEYFSKARNILVSLMDDTRAGLSLHNQTYMNSSIGYGTAGILATRGQTSFFKFMVVDVKTVSVAENNEGFIDTIYMKYKRTVRQLEQEFGEKSLSEKTRELIKNKKFDEEIECLYVIEPRRERDPKKKDNLNMPFVSAYIEVANKHLIKESGFEEFPGGVSRFDKNTQEKYGRSPGIKCLPDTLEINTVRESRTVAREKQLDPPLIVYDDGRLGGGVINTSAGAINVVNVAGRSTNSQNDSVKPLITVGDLRVATEEVEELKQVITGHFSIDRLLDLNNETEMTLGEAQIRDQKNSLATGGSLVRQIAETYTPLIERCFNMAFREGKLGVIEGSPQHQLAVLTGDDPLIIPPSVARFMGSQDKVFEIIYNTPAARILKAQEAAAMLQTWQSAQLLAQTNPEVLDNLDADKTIRKLGAINGSEEIFRSVKTRAGNPGVDQIREERAKNVKQAQAQAKADEQATLAKAAQPTQQ